MHEKFIRRDEAKTTMILYLKDRVLDEAPTNELEKPQIVERTYDITIGDIVHSLVSGV